MAYSEANKNYFDFNKGIITEVTPLNRPEGTSIDEENFELFIDGSRKRRKGLAFENSAHYHSGVADNSADRGLSASSVYRWDNVASDGNTSFAVVKDASYVYLYDESDSVFTASGIMKGSNIIDLYEYRSSTSITRVDIDEAVFSFSSGMGFMFINSPVTEMLMVTWDDSNNDLVVYKVTPWERDLDGLEDGLVGNAKPVTLSVNHAYNLTNQGWPTNHYTTYFTTNGVYPSNAQIWHYGKLITPSTGREGFDVQHLDAQDFGNAPAPKGRFIKNIYDHDENYITYHVASVAGTTVSWNNTTKLWTITTVDPHGLIVNDIVLVLGGNIRDNVAGQKDDYDLTGRWFVNSVPSATTFTVNVPSYSNTNTTWEILEEMSVILPGSVGGTLPPYWDNTNTKRYSTNAFFANRLWIGGMDDERYGTRIYYSQIGTTPDKLTKFYQESDPTSEHIADLYPTDGGFVSIPDMGNLIRMEVFGKHLIIFADNGVWAVGPGDALEFRADDYSVVELARLDLIEREAIVKTDSDIIFWTSEGMYVVTKDQVAAAPIVQNITKNTIQTLYHTALENNRMPIKGTYDNVNKKIFWVYNDVTASDWNGTYNYDWQANRILILDVAIGAWYRYTLATNVSSTVFQPLAILTPKEYADKDTSVKMLCLGSTAVGSDLLHWHTFSNDTNFQDFADSYLISSIRYHPIPKLDTSYEIMGDAMRNKFANYVFCYFNRTEDTAVANGGDFDLDTPSGCLMSARWDWSEDSISGKHGNLRQVYRLGKYLPPGAAGAWTNGFPVVVTKNKVRGTGRSLHLHFEGEEDKDLQLLGWSINLQGVTKP